MKSARPVVVGVGVAALLIAAAVTWTTRGLPNAKQSHAAGSSSEQPVSLGSDKAPVARAPIASRSSGSASSASPRIGDALSGAKTEADVAWLVRNGYPSTEAARDALLRRGARGPLEQAELLDPTAILDAEQLALLDSSRRTEAMEFLAASAQSGSIYALETIARIHEDGVDGISDPVRASAYRKAAELRGSWPAGLVNGRSKLTPQQEMYATLMAHQVIANIEVDRQKNGLPPLGIDSRPGLNDLISEIAKSGAPAAR